MTKKDDEVFKKLYQPIDQYKMILKPEAPLNGKKELTADEWNRKLKELLKGWD